MSKHNHNHKNTGSAGPENRMKDVKGNPQNNAASPAGGLDPKGEVRDSGAARGVENDTVNDAKNSAKSQAESSSEAAGTQANSASKDSEAKNAAGENGVEAWKQKSADLEFKLAELNDQYLRKAADFDNFRKRVNREKQELSDFANQNLLLDLLPVIDDFERAIKSADTSKDFSSFYTGVSMIEKGLSAQLEKKWGLKRFDSEGQPFDPNRHEAIQMEKSAEVSEATVKEDFLKGYLLKDRVLRFAKVKVLMPETPAGMSAGTPAGSAASSPAGASAGISAGTPAGSDSP